MYGHPKLAQIVTAGMIVLLAVILLAALRGMARGG